MLSDRSRPVIEATLPVVADHIEEIATRFYAHLFGEHPELLDGIFNRGNQAEKTQQMALAGSVAVFASSLVKVPEQLPEHLLSRIAHKHASLGITPAQYDVVHDNLFWAIVDVLGDAVTPEVAAAWDEVYWLMAYALINQERGLYSARGVRPETVWREWEVAEKIQETEDVVTFRMRRTDDRLVKTSLPGQYVTVQVPMPDGVRQPRQYSLTRADDGEHRQFSVKRVRGEGKPDGEVSNLLCDRVAGRRPADHVAALRRRRPRRLGPPGRVRQRRASASPRWPACCPTWRRRARTCRSPCCTPTSTRRPSPCATRCSTTSRRCPAHRRTSGTSAARRARLPVEVHAGVMDLDDVKLPDDAIVLPVRAAAVHAGGPQRADRAGVPARDIQYEVFGPDLWQADLATEETPGASDATRPPQRLTPHPSMPGRRRRRQGSSTLLRRRAWTSPRCGPTSPRRRPPATRPRCTSTRTCS